MASPWQAVVARKRHAQETVIASFEAEVLGKCSAQPTTTSLLDFESLQGSFSSGEVSAEAATREYIQRAIIAHKKTNCLTEITFHEAIHDARVLDSYFAKHKKPIGPLHGIPMSLKDQFNVQGHDTTLGYVGRSFSPASQDATIVKMLRSLKAVIVAKTNIPQSIMWSETDNPLWGLTTNPMHPGYTPGGSSGGESSLLAMNGSMIGWGTDIGGSIRAPAHMMGLYGFKPSSARLPYNGVPVSTEGQEHVPSSVGPLARDFASIYAVMKGLIDAKPWEQDARCAPLPWRSEVFNEHLSRPLTIGVLLDDGVVRPHPPVTRVLMSVIEVLKRAGHDIVDWNASLHAEMIAVQDEFYTVDGGEDIRLAVAEGGEPFIPAVEKLVNRGQPISVYQYWQLNKRKVALQQAYLEKWHGIRSSTTGRPVDVVLMPPMPHTSVPHGGCRWVGYTKVWNFLDYTSLVMPAGRVDAVDGGTRWAYETQNELDEWNSKLWRDNKEEMVGLGLPVGIQIVGQKLEDEKVLAVAQVIKNLIKVR